MTDIPTPAPVTEDEHGSLAWPELLAVTLLIAFVAAIASGWFDLILPWKGSGS